jgi:hypothetical protein
MLKQTAAADSNEYENYKYTLQKKCLVFNSEKSNLCSNHFALKRFNLSDLHIQMQYPSHQFTYGNPCRYAKSLSSTSARLTEEGDRPDMQTNNEHRSG